MKPITPQEAGVKKIDGIDPLMIQAINELIVEKLQGKYAIILQIKIVERYLRLKNIEDIGENRRKLVDDRHQLDFEPIFEKAGWKVTYDKPGFNESYSASFKFESKYRR